MGNKTQVNVELEDISSRNHSNAEKDQNATVSCTGTGEDSNGEIDVYIDPALERKYVRTLDFKLLPVLCAIYFCSAMDRSNIGNAYSDGMSEDLHFVGQEYSNMLLFFYIPTAFLDLPWNIATKKFGGRYILPLLAFCWGCFTIAHAGAKNYPTILGLRLCVGVFEAGYFAGCIFYLTLFYTRQELATRMAIFVCASILAAAFTGLIAFAIFRIENAPLAAWKYLFIIEGGATTLISIFAAFWLPSTPSDCKFLSSELKEVARLRILKFSSKAVDSKFSWAECKARIMTWQWPVYFVISFTYPLPWTTASLFLTSIIKNFGYSTVKTNLYTIAPNLVGAVIVLCIARSSDYFRERSYHLCFALSLSIIGLIILATVDSALHTGVCYFACFLLCAGAYNPSALVHSWHNNNNLSESSRSFDSGVFVGLSNLASITASATFRTNYAPRYIPTISATCASAGICLIVSFCLGTWQKLENRRRDREQGVHLRNDQVVISELVDGVNDPRWRYYT